MKSPGRALETDAKIGNAAVRQNPQVNLSTIPDLINFNYTGEGIKFVILINVWIIKEIGFQKNINNCCSGKTNPFNRKI